MHFQKRIKLLGKNPLPIINRSRIHPYQQKNNSAELKIPIGGSSSPCVNQIKCLKQRTLQGGDSTCGIHCDIKNLLAMTAINEGYDQTKTSLFTDTKFYEHIETSFCLIRGNDNRSDAEEEDLVKFWGAVTKGEVNPLLILTLQCFFQSKSHLLFFNLRAISFLQHFQHHYNRLFKFLALAKTRVHFAI